MIKTVVAGLSALLLMSGTALAQNCAGNYPFPLANNTNADADQVMANFDYIRNCANGITASIDDTNRRNILLNSAFIAKLNGAYVRNINSFADGYANSSGINAGSSTNYAVDTVGKSVGPSLPTTTVTINSPGGSLGAGSYTLVDRTTAVLNSQTVISIGVNSNVTGTFVVKILKRNSAGNYDVVVSESSMSHAGGGWQDYALTAPYAVPASGTYYLGAYGTTASAMQSTANVARAYSLSNVTGSSQTLTEDTQVAYPMRYAYSTGAANNMTVVTTAQTPDATATKNRVLLEYSPNNITINTDLTAEVTCDGTAWTAAALVAAGTAQAGHNVAETADTTCSAGGGSFAARLKTFNNKNIQIFKTTVTAH